MSQSETFADELPGSTQQGHTALLMHGDTHLPEVALTFDDGPSAEYTLPMLAILRRYHIQATFFMLGTCVQRHPDLARAVIADGHAIGNHTWDHPSLTRLGADQVLQQLTRTLDVIEQATGMHTPLFRPPYGYYNRQTLAVAGSLQLSAVLWNVDPLDWSCPGSQAIITHTLSRSNNGAIILLHDAVYDGGGSREQTLQALPVIIEQLQARAFKFVTIPQVLAHLQPSSLDRFLEARLPPRVFRLLSRMR
jgi:peptidoglycan/xylan/chitin deacetylase (PgdA/CDA1 family)